MAVSNETIIQKMMQELNKAKVVSHNTENMTKHIEHVKLLCELLLEDKDEYTNQATSKTRTKITAAEMKAMMGRTDSKKVTPSSAGRIDHGDANGESIFDF